MSSPIGGEGGTSTTLALRVNTAEPATVAGYLSHLTGAPTSRLTVRNLQLVEVAAIEATALVEAIASSSSEAGALAELLGASDAALQRLQSAWEHAGTGTFQATLAEKLGATLPMERDALQRLVSGVSGEDIPGSLDVAEAAARLRHSTTEEGVHMLTSSPFGSLAALSDLARAYSLQAARSDGVGLQVRVDALCPRGPLRQVLQRRLERALTLPLQTAARDAPAPSSRPALSRQARQLHAAGTGLACGTDEDVFIEIIGFADATQARALRYEYAMRSAHTLGSAVSAEMSGDLAALLLAFLHPPPSALGTNADHDLAEAQARRLWRASEGRGYDGAEWAAVFGEASAAQLAAIMRVMARHGLPLPALIRDEFSGDAKELLLVRCRWAASRARQAPHTPLGLVGAAVDSGAPSGGSGVAGGAAAEAAMAAARAAMAAARAALAAAAAHNTHSRTHRKPGGCSEVAGQIRQGSGSSLHLWAALIASVSAPS